MVKARAQLRSKPRGRLWSRALRAGVVLGAVFAIAAWPVSTRQGVNYEVSTHRLPLALKATSFVERSAQYRQLAREITTGLASQEAAALAVFEWTHRNVRQVPAGFPVVDDHILNIVTRGYGTGDQQADVFATLATYAGVPAFWARVPEDRTKPGIILSFARLDNRWRVFDVHRHLAFRAADGGLADLPAVRSRVDALPVSLVGEIVDGRPYAQILREASMPSIPSPLRAELQMPLARTAYELRRLLGFPSSS